MSRSAARLTGLALMLASDSVRYAGFDQVNGHVGTSTSMTSGWGCCCWGAGMTDTEATETPGPTLRERRARAGHPLAPQLTICVGL